MRLRLRGVPDRKPRFAGLFRYFSVTTVTGWAAGARWLRMLARQYFQTRRGDAVLSVTPSTTTEIARFATIIATWVAPISAAAVSMLIEWTPRAAGRLETSTAIRTGALAGPVE